MLMERLARAGHDTGVEGGRDWEADRPQPGRLELVGHSVDRIDRARQHDFRGCIVVRNHDVVRRIDQTCDSFGVTRHRDHRTRRTGCSLGHQLPTLARRRQERVLIDAPGRCQGR